MVLPNLTTVFAFIQVVAIVVTAAVYLLSVGRKEKERVGDKEISDAIERQNTIIESLKGENVEITRQFQALKLENTAQRVKIEGLQSEVERWKDAATNKTAISEVRAIIQTFQDQIPAQQQLVAEFQKNDRDTIQSLKEIRETLRTVVDILDGNKKIVHKQEAK